MLRFLQQRARIPRPQHPVCVHVFILFPCCPSQVPGTVHECGNNWTFRRLINKQKEIKCKGTKLGKIWGTLEGRSGRWVWSCFVLYEYKILKIKEKVLTFWKRLPSIHRYPLSMTQKSPLYPPYSTMGLFYDSIFEFGAHLNWCYLRTHEILTLFFFVICHRISGLLGFCDGQCLSVVHGLKSRGRWQSSEAHHV